MKKLDRCFFYKNYLAKQGIFSYHSSVVLAHPLFQWMMLRGERTGCQVWFFLFLFHTPIYTKEYGYTIAKTACRKKQHARIELLFIIKILIRCKPAVIDKFNSPANTRHPPAHARHFCSAIATASSSLYAAHPIIYVAAPSAAWFPLRAVRMCLPITLLYL